MDLLCGTVGERYCVMEIVSNWYVVLLVGVLIGAVFSKSLIMNLGLIFVCVLGMTLAMELGEGVSDVLRYGLMVLYVCLLGFGCVQIATRVERI